MICKGIVKNLSLDWLTKKTNNLVVRNSTRPLNRV